MSRLFIVLFGITLTLSVLPLIACTGEIETNEKASSLLLTQVTLRKEQIAEPDPERLEIMKDMGMSVDNLAIQRIFIHLAQEPSQSQVAELEAMGITLYPDSWIPPVGEHPTGFMLADMPVDRLADLAAKKYIIRLDTAERQLEPQGSSQPQAS
jgi:hypothetical protein